MGRGKQADVLDAQRAPAEVASLGEKATKVGRALCLLGALVGAVGLFSSITGIALLARLFPGAPQMRANTALSLVLIGVAAALRRDEAAPSTLRILTGAAAALVLAVAVATLVEYACGVDVSIDQLLFRSGFQRFHGRSSAPSALALTMLSVALLLFDARPRAGTRLSAWMISTAGLFGFVAIVGVTFGAGAVDRMRSAPVTGVPGPTALGLLLVSTGMLLERPTVGIARLATAPGPGGALLRRLVVPAMLVPMLLAFGISRLFDFLGIQDVALLFATLVALTTVAGVALISISVRPLEGALRISEARYAGLVSIADDAIISVSERQRIVIFNQGAERIFGWKAADVLGKPLDILIPQRFRQRHPQHLRDFASQPEKARKMGANAEIAGLRKNGEEFPAEAAISKLPVDGGQIFTIVLRDVTEQRRAANEERFLAEVGAVLATTLDFEDTLASVGRLALGPLADACVVESGADRDSIRRLTFTRGGGGEAGAGQRPREAADAARPMLGSIGVQTDEPLLVPEVTEDVLESLSETDEDLHALHALHPVSLIAVPLIAQGGKVGSLILIRRAPSQRYGPRDLFLAQEMARRAALAIESARLYHLAQRAIHVRDDVLGIVAHDLRNPLSAVAMQADLLVHTLDGSSRAYRAAQGIGRAAARMNRLIEDLLDVTRIEAGRLSIDPRPQPTAQIVAEVLEMQRPIAAAAAVELQAQLALDLPDVMADRDRLIEVFENLIGNAAKFAPRGGLVIVGAKPRGADVLFWVADNGPGIPSDAVAHLFDRFWQAKRNDRRGAGLGLPIVKGIVEEHGGNTWVETAPGRGTTFFFTIPAAAGSGAWQNAPALH